jgi:hypothetical protein
MSLSIGWMHKLLQTYGPNNEQYNKLISVHSETPVSLSLLRRMALCRTGGKVLINYLRITSYNSCLLRLRKSLHRTGLSLALKDY